MFDAPGTLMHSNSGVKPLRRLSAESSTSPTARTDDSLSHASYHSPTHSASVDKPAEHYESPLQAIASQLSWGNLDKDDSPGGLNHSEHRPRAKKNLDGLSQSEHVPRKPRVKAKAPVVVKKSSHATGITSSKEQPRDPPGKTGEETASPRRRGLARQLSEQALAGSSRMFHALVSPRRHKEKSASSRNLGHHSSHDRTKNPPKTTKLVKSASERFDSSKSLARKPASPRRVNQKAPSPSKTEILWSGAVKQDLLDATENEALTEIKDTRASSLKDAMTRTLSFRSSNHTQNRGRSNSPRRSKNNDAMTRTLSFRSSNHTQNLGRKTRGRSHSPRRGQKREEGDRGRSRTRSPIRTIVKSLSLRSLCCTDAKYAVMDDNATQEQRFPSRASRMPIAAECKLNADCDNDACSVTEVSIASTTKSFRSFSPKRASKPKKKETSSLSGLHEALMFNPPPSSQKSQRRGSKDGSVRRGSANGAQDRKSQSLSPRRMMRKMESDRGLFSAQRRGSNESRSRAKHSAGKTDQRAGMQKQVSERFQWAKSVEKPRRRDSNESRSPVKNSAGKTDQRTDMQKQVSERFQWAKSLEKPTSIASSAEFSASPVKPATARKLVKSKSPDKTPSSPRRSSGDSVASKIGSEPGFAQIAFNKKTHQCKVIVSPTSQRRKVSSIGDLMDAYDHIVASDSEERKEATKCLSMSGW